MCLVSTLLFFNSHIQDEMPDIYLFIHSNHPTYSAFKVILPEEEGRASVNTLVLFDYLLY